MSRIEGVKQDIDQNQTLEFFERRAAGATVATSHAATSFSAPEESEERHLSEVAQALPRLELSEASRVLDVGCGGGRWAHTLLRESAVPVELYTGVDFSPSLIAFANARQLGSMAQFHVMPAEALDRDALKAPGGYSHTLVTALCLYLNDHSLAKMVAAIADLASSDGLFYLREPVSLTGNRLTLVQEFSEKIGDQYSAIYRTPEEYDALVSAHFDILDTQFLEGPAFHRHTTTRHRYVVARVKR